MIAKGTSHSVTAASVQTSKSQTPGNNPKYHRLVQSREEYILYIKEVLFYFHHWSVTCSHSHGCWCGYCTFSCNVTVPILSLNHCKAFFTHLKCCCVKMMHLTVVACLVRKKTMSILENFSFLNKTKKNCNTYSNWRCCKWCANMHLSLVWQSWATLTSQCFRLMFHVVDVLTPCDNGVLH